MIYLDASAAVSQFILDRHSSRIRALLAGGGLVIAISDFCIAEFAASVSRHLRIGRYGSKQAAEIIDLFETWATRQARSVTTSREDVARATALIKRFDLGLRAPDALHLALCERSGATLMTFDGNQAAAAATLGIPLAA